MSSMCKEQLQDELAKMPPIIETSQDTSAGDTTAKKPKKRKSALGNGATSSSAKKKRKTGILVSSNTPHDPKHNISSSDYLGLEEGDVMPRFEQDDHIPDDLSAQRIGQVRGKVYHGGKAIPGDAMIESKRDALSTNTSPWYSWNYIKLVDPPPQPSASGEASPSNIGEPQALEQPSAAAATLGEPSSAAATLGQPPAAAANSAPGTVSSPSPVRPSRLEDPVAQFSEALAKRKDMIWKGLPLFPTWSQVMKAYGNAPKLEMSVKEAHPLWSHL